MKDGQQDAFTSEYWAYQSAPPPQARWLPPFAGGISV